jgi:hypothetical protein
MYRKLFRIFGGAILCGAILIGSLLFIFTNETNASKATDSKIKLNEKVKYTLIRGKATNGGSKISILHKFKDESEIKDFVSLANSKLTELSKEKDFDKTFIATVTLKEPISVQEFEDFVPKYEIDICDYKMRAFEEDGLRVTIMSKPKNGSLFNFERISEDMDLNTIAGVIAFTCNVNKNNLDKLAEMKNDNRVYVIDVDSYFIGNDVSKQTGKNIEKVKANDIYWYVEDYKLNEQ